MDDDEFGRRIAAATERAKMAKRKIGEQDVQKLGEVVTEWKGRIRPLVEQEVAKANQKLDEAGIKLVLTPETVRTISGPILLAKIIAEGAPPRRSKLAGDREPSLGIRLADDGRIDVTARGCTITRKDPLLPEQFNQEQAKELIADFVDALAALQ